MGSTIEHLYICTLERLVSKECETKSGLKRWSMFQTERERERGEEGMYPIADAGYEGLDVQLRGARLLTGGVRALEAAGGLAQRRSLAEGRVLYVVKVVPFAAAGLGRERGGGGQRGEEEVSEGRRVSRGAHGAVLVLVSLPVLLGRLGPGGGD